MITKAIDNAFKLKEKRGWDKVYYFIDLHSTVVRSNYTTDDIPRDFYPGAVEVLSNLTKMDDIVLIMYTCSHEHEIVKYVEYFKEFGIVFDYINENPEVKTDLNGYGCYDKKPYMSVLMDDKAGFDGETDWIKIGNYFIYGDL